MPPPHSPPDDADMEEDTESIDWSVGEPGPKDVAPTVMDADIEVFAPPRPDVLQEAWLMLDEVDVGRIFNQRAAVMKSFPHCLKGPFRTALKLAFEQILETERSEGGN